jgi:hypothetical protein
LETAAPQGISKALDEVLVRARSHLEANERAEAARHVQLLLERSGLGDQEFASRIGVPREHLSAYLDASVSPPAAAAGAPQPPPVVLLLRGGGAGPALPLPAAAWARRARAAG